MAHAELTLEIQQLIDNKFGHDIANLPQIKKLYADIVARKDAIEKEMQVPTNCDGSGGEGDGAQSSSYKNGVAKVLEQFERCANVQERKDQLSARIDDLLQPSTAQCEQFHTSDKEIKKLERYILYMKYAAKIDETSESVQQSILSDSMTDACVAFKRLITYHGCLIEKSTKCTNVTNHLHQTIMFWYRILKDKLSKELEKILQLIEWPFVQGKGPDTIMPQLADVAASQQPSQHQQHQQRGDPNKRLEAVIGNLLNVQLPKHVRTNSPAATKEHEKADEDEENSVVLLPFQIMLRPLRKRFHYHFTGNRETNLIERPEWYLSQVSNWVEYHSGFLENTIQPILNKHKHSYVDALVMFTQGLLQLVTSKLSVDIDVILQSDQLFSHLVDEVLIFDRGLRNVQEIPASLLQLYSPLNVLALPKCIDKWLAIEKAWAHEKLEGLLTQPRSWKPKLAAVSNLEDDVDESKVPECGESVVTMLLTVTDRYKHLPSWEQKVRFLDFQLSILDDFRLRITQVIRSLNSTSEDSDHLAYAIINTAHYITNVLADLADNFFFLELKHHKEKFQAKSDVVPPSLVQLGENPSGGGAIRNDETVFDEAILLYKKITEDAINTVTHRTLTELKTKCYPYITEAWSSLPEPGDQVTMVVSGTVCPFLSALQDRLNFLEDKLTSHIFSKLWRQLADGLDKFIFHEVVVKNSFNTGGAAQLQFDMRENLFPLFRSLTKKPENFFKRVKEACLLLNLQLGSALLLKETVVEEENSDAAKKILAEMGVHLIVPRDAAVLLTKRTDWPQHV